MERPGIYFVKVTQRLKAGNVVCLPGRHVVPGDMAVSGVGCTRKVCSCVSGGWCSGEPVFTDL